MPLLLRQIIIPAVILLVCGCAGTPEPPKPWMGLLRNELKHLGARNWIVIGEAAFPAPSRRGLRVITVDDEIPNLLDGIEQLIEEKYHVKPRIYMTTESAAVEYDYAPGIKAYRKEIKEALHGREVIQLDNEMLMRLMNDTTKSYRVLVIKSRTALPYSSVFIELGSGYWDADSESALRKAMDKKKATR